MFVHSACCITQQRVIDKYYKLVVDTFLSCNVTNPHCIWNFDEKLGKTCDDVSLYFDKYQHTSILLKLTL